MAFEIQPVDFSALLARKYALLQQQADAGTRNAGSDALRATTDALVGRSVAGLNDVRAETLPGESAAQIALQRSQAGLNNAQASVVVPESQARIGQITADTKLTTTNNRIAIREGLTPRPILGGALGSVFGAGGYQGFRLPTAAGAISGRRAGESEAAYLDRINGL